MMLTHIKPEAKIIEVEDNDLKEVNRFPCDGYVSTAFSDKFLTTTHYYHMVRQPTYFTHQGNLTNN